MFCLFSLEVKANDLSPHKAEIEEVFNVGKMLSHDHKFTLYFRTREKAVLAKGEEYNYITDYPQDLYILYNDTGKTSPVITYDWFPKKVKELGLNYDLPIFPVEEKYRLRFIFSLLKNCGYKDINSTYECSFYKPLISENLIN